MGDKTTLMSTYGITAREADFLLEYMREVGEVDELTIPLIISNLRNTLSLLDRVIHRKFTIADLHAEFVKYPPLFKERFDDCPLLAAMELHGLSMP